MSSLKHVFNCWMDGLDWSAPKGLDSWTFTAFGALSCTLIECRCTTSPAHLSGVGEGGHFC